jgi:hypothetical protein
LGYNGLQGLQISRLIKLSALSTFDEDGASGLTPGKKIPGDRLVLGLLSAFRTLVMELSKNGVLDHDEFVHILQQTAEAHREAGDPNRLADAIYAISLQIATSIPGPDSDIH